MKKIIISLALVILALTANAQGVKHTAWGVRAGADFMKLSGFKATNEYSFPPLVGFYAGAFAEWEEVFGKFGIRGELSYAGQGNKCKGKVTDGIVINRVNYLLLPVMIEYPFFENTLHVMAGPQFGLCLGGNTKTKTGGVTTTTSWSKDSYNTFDFSLVFGVEYMLSPSIGVELRYNLGLTNMYAASYSSTTRANRGFQFGLDYKF